MIEVIHVRDADFSDPRTVYIGGPHGRDGHNLSPSPLRNPFKPTKDSPDPRRNSIEAFDEYLVSCLKNPFMKHADHIEEFARLLELARTGDLRLACWCAPEPCHGDVIKRELENRSS